MRLSLCAALLAIVFATPLAAQSLTASSPAARAALAHVRGEASARGLTPADAADLVVSSAHTDARTGLSYVYVQQQVGGIDVAEAVVTIAIGANGRVVHAAGDLVAGAAQAAKAPSLTPDAAVTRAASLVGVLAPTLVRAVPETGTERKTTFLPIAGTDVTARLVYVRTPTDGLRLAWETTVPTRDTQHIWMLRVDAQTGAEISRHDLVVHDTFGPAAPASLAPLATPATFSALAPGMVGSYTVYPLPLESPAHGTTLPPADGRTAVANPDDATASPFGWHDTNGAAGAEFTTTQGNNVHAYTDTDANNIPDTGSSPDGGASLVFNFPVDLTQAPSTYRPASVTNLFYWNNVIHDVMYQYGFNEASGNFQTNNYGRGGLGNDYVRAEAQDGSGTNNANFFTPADGSLPRMQMYIGVDVTPNRDGSFDNGVVVHEYGHGISNRLTGGPAAATCLQNAEQQGEGWSDFYGLMFSMRPGDTRTTLRPIGTYLFGQEIDGPGIRLAPYSTDFAVNSYTYERTKYMTAVHQIGFVWATILWEATWDMIDAHGFDPDLYNATGTAGNQMMMRLVTEGLRLQPCSPGFVSSRDAILAADAALYPSGTPGQGLHYSLLWNAFARRGLGFSASQGVTSSNTDNTEAFDTPLAAPQMSYAPGTLSFSLQTGQTDSKVVVVSNAAAPGSSDLNVTPYLANFSSAVAARGPVAQLAPRTPSSLVSGTLNVSRAAAAAPVSEMPAAPLAVPAASPARGEIPVGAKAAVVCEDGESLDQFSATFTTTIASGAQELGQSITAPCSGLLVNVLPVINASSSPNSSWAFTMRVYEGAGTGGTQLAAGNYTYTNPPSGVFLLTVPLPTPVEITEGQVYTWFLDMTSGSTVTQYASTNVYPGGVRYRTTNGNPANAIASTGDMQFSVDLSSPDVWARVLPRVASAAPGGSVSIEVEVDATGLADGTYTADLILETNDLASAMVTIPVQLVVGAAPGTATLDGDPGWYLMGSPTASTTVDQLAALNLVAGVPGYYPTFSGGPPATPTLYTGYNGGSWTASTGTGQVIPSGKGFLWYFWDAAFTPTEPTTFASSAVAFPVTLTAPGAVNTADASVVLHTSGNRINALGNPFGTTLDLTGVASWPGGKKVASRGRAYVWDPVTNSWIYGAAAASVEPWQGFAVRSKTSGGTLTIPASAASAAKAPTETRRVLAFELEGRDAETGRVLRDRSLEVSFEDGATAGWDEADAEKLAPLAQAFVSLGVLAEQDGRSVLKAGESQAFAPVSFEVPLALETAGADAALTLRWPTMTDLPSGWRLSLRDLATGAEVDLRSADRYTFEATPRARKAVAMEDGTPALVDAAAADASVRFVLSVQTGIAPETALTTLAFGLDEVAPNPARGNARVAFTLADAAEALVSVYDVQGREVAVLATGRREAGRHEVAWPTGALAPGVYVVRLQAGADLATRRAVVVR